MVTLHYIDDMKCMLTCSLLPGSTIKLLDDTDTLQNIGPIGEHKAEID